MAGERRFHVYGHRGSPREARENTMESFRAALSAGADGFETDLRLAADGEVVLFHDARVGGRLAEELTTQELGAGAGPLTRARELAGLGPAVMILEVKRGGFDDWLVEFADGRANAIVSSFDHRLIERLASRGRIANLGLVVSGRLCRPSAYISSTGANWLFPEKEYVDRELVEECHAAGIAVVPWTANSEELWASLLEAGCDGVITDLPGAAVKWRGLGAGGS